MSDLDELTERVRRAIGQDSGLGKTLKIDLMGGGYLFIDGGSVSNENKPADLTITITMDDLKALASGQLDPTSAVMGGQMQLSDMGLAMSLQNKLQDLFSRLSS
jgi:putative sterol carrier protein